MPLQSCDSASCLICGGKHDESAHRAFERCDAYCSTCPKEGEHREGNLEDIYNFSDDRRSSGHAAGGHEERVVPELFKVHGCSPLNLGGSGKPFSIEDVMQGCGIPFNERETYRCKEHKKDSRLKLISGLDFKRGTDFLASVSTSKEVCVFRLNTNACEGSLGDVHDPMWTHRLAGRPCCACWNNESTVVSVGDNEGVVTQVEVESGHIFCEKDIITNGKPVLDLTRQRNFSSTCLLSAGGDGSVRLWSRDLCNGLDIIGEGKRGSVPACAVAFSPVDPYKIAVALSSSEVLSFDVRHPEKPLSSFLVGSCPTAHLEYLENGDLVCSNLNSEISVWAAKHLDAGGNDVVYTKRKVCRGHRQTKNFVGLSTQRNLIATGSEDGNAYVYRVDSEKPVATVPTSSLVTEVHWVPQEVCSDKPNLIVATGEGLRRYELM